MADLQDLQRRIDQLESENAKLKSRIEAAKTYFLEQKRELQYTETRVKATLSRNLQKTRVCLYGLGHELHAYAITVSHTPNSALTLTHVNTLQMCLQDIVNNLSENGLWDPEKDSLMPDLSIVEEETE